jgi:hypothetical protein
MFAAPVTPVAVAVLLRVFEASVESLVLGGAMVELTSELTMLLIVLCMLSLIVCRVLFSVVMVDVSRDDGVLVCAATSGDDAFDAACTVVAKLSITEPISDSFINGALVDVCRIAAGVVVSDVFDTFGDAVDAVDGDDALSKLFVEVFDTLSVLDVCWPSWLDDAFDSGPTTSVMDIVTDGTVVLAVATPPSVVAFAVCAFCTVVAKLSMTLPISVSFISGAFVDDDPNVGADVKFD